MNGTKHVSLKIELCLYGIIIKSCVVYMLIFSFQFCCFCCCRCFYSCRLFSFFPLCEPVATDLYLTQMYLTFIKQEFKKNCFEAYYCYLPVLQLARVCYVYWLSKFVEYLDTVSTVDTLPQSTLASVYSRITSG